MLTWLKYRGFAYLRCILEDAKRFQLMRAGLIDAEQKSDAVLRQLASFALPGIIFLCERRVWELLVK